MRASSTGPTNVSPNIKFESNNLARPIVKDTKALQGRQPAVPPIKIGMIRAELTAGMRPVEPGRAGRDQSGLPEIRLFSNRVLRRELYKTRGKLPREVNKLADVLIRAADELIDPGHSNTAPTKQEHQQQTMDLDQADQPADHKFLDEHLDDQTILSNQIAYIVKCMRTEAAKYPGNSLEAQQQRRSTVIDFLGSIVGNRFENVYGRVACNVLNSGGRTALFVALWTLMRDGIAFEVSKADELSGDQAALSIPCIAAIALAPALNIVGFVSSFAQGTANWYSNISRLALITFNLAALAAIYVVIRPPVVATNLVGKALWPFITYNLARDWTNLLLPVRDNLRSLPVRAVGLSAGIYGLLQWTLGVPMSLLAPRSGAGALPQAVGNATVPREVLATAKFDWWDSVTHGMGNGILEWLDDLTLPYLAKYFENKDYHLKYASDMRDEAVHKQYIEELTVFAKDLLKKPAGKRQKSIDKLNYSLYERELKRLAPLRDELDEVHEQYRENLQQEFLTFVNTIKLTDLWATWRDNLDAFDLKNLDYLTNLEWQLGVYKKPRELERLKRLERLDSAQLTEAQVQNLAELRTAVEQEFYELSELEKLARNNELDDNDKKRLESLQYQFNEVDDLKPAKLRPMAALMSKKTLQLPDFSKFDKEIHDECRRRIRSFKAPKRKIIQEEIFVYQFLMAYLPLQIFTPLEEKVMESIDAKPDILLSQSVDEMVREVEKKRHEDADGLRLRLGLFSLAAGWAETIGQKLLVTNAARQGAFATVIETLIALSFLIPKDSDDTTQASVANGIVALVVFMCYMPLILTHMEGWSSTRPVRRPGAQGLPPLREYQGAVDEVTTPRAGSDGPKTDARELSEAEVEAEAVELGKAEGGAYEPSDGSDSGADTSADSEAEEADYYEPFQAKVGASDTREPAVEARPNNKKLERQDTIVVELNKLLEQ